MPINNLLFYIIVMKWEFKVHMLDIAGRNTPLMDFPVYVLKIEISHPLIQIKPYGYTLICIRSCASENLFNKLQKAFVFALPAEHPPL